MFDFMFILYFGDLVWSMNNYGALLLVESIKSIGEPVSVVKLRVSLLTLWFGVLVLCMGKTENYGLSKKNFEADILMYMVVIVDPISPVPGT